LLLTATLALAPTCGVVNVESYTAHPNGKLAVLRGDADAKGLRMGVWVYYAQDGSVEYECTIGGAVIDGTGVYEHGVRVRMPTEAELAAARRRADKIEARW
jgi:hypothetical protein